MTVSSPLRLVALGCVALLQTSCAWTATGTYELANGYIRLVGSGPALQQLAFDPTGSGKYSANLLRTGGFAGLEAPPEVTWTREGNVLTVSGLELCVQDVVEPQKCSTPDRLLPGHVLGQSFTATGTFTQVAVKAPTWNTDTSGALLRLRRGGPEGEVVASRQCEKVADNSYVPLTFEPQPAGKYLIEWAEPVGTVGWWSSQDEQYAGGEAYLDGKPLPGRDRSIRVSFQRPVGKARLRYALEGPTLEMTLESLTGGLPAAFPLILRLPWDNTGYDVSAKAVPFFRFFTDNQRYLPVEQFKRAGSPGVSIGSCAWLEAEGTGNYDLRFSGAGLAASWDTTSDTASFRLSSRAQSGPGESKSVAVSLRVMPREDSVPEGWPSFETPDAELTRDLNRFWYERAFSYPAPSGPAAWYEWSALIRYWFGGPLHDGEANNLRNARMSDEGYVYTWGGSAGWPFPDNAVFDTRHFDTNARFILACWRHLCWTQDLDFLRSQLPRVRRAMEYQLTILKGEEGLIVAASKDVTGRHKGTGNNYWDILPFGHLDAYANTVYYASLEAMAQVEELAARQKLTTETTARTSDYYRTLAQKTREAYNRTFWDEEKGRYIGCVDADGKRHDYGFTFVNLEAMAYGLATPEQAKRVYEWMEHGKSSSGEADIYSRWIFAPRATTIHNPMWNDKGVQDPKAERVEPWWMFGWRGTPFGDQCQDGGAILYTSYFDLMARTSLRGTESAWQRWNEILGRYRMPDRLCGGPPLSRGENPQQANPGSTGTDIPFPESGLVPCWFVYGVAGVNATSQGLVISPRLPKQLPWLVIRNLQYRGLTMDLRVQSLDDAGVRVELSSRRPGAEFSLRRDLKPQEKLVITDPPAPLKAWPQVVQLPSGWQAQWIWAAGDSERVTRVFLRRSFDLAQVPPAAKDRAEVAPVAVTVDNAFRLYVNGVLALNGEGWEQPQRVDLQPFLRKGRNVLAVEGINAGGPAGVLLQAKIPQAGKAISIVSDATWKVSDSEVAGWQGTDFDDSAWQAAVTLGAPPSGPWGDVAGPGF